LHRQASEVKALIEPAVRHMGYELVGVEFASVDRSLVLRLYIDAPEGVTLGDCERVSRHVSGLLDVEDPIHSRYALEVSSPGLDRPLFAAGDYARFAGQRACIRLRVPWQGRRKFTGKIIGVQEEHVRLEEEGAEFAIPLGAIQKANLAPER
jgi:ribosome maturation factor RimP